MGMVHVYSFDTGCDVRHAVLAYHLPIQEEVQCEPAEVLHLVAEEAPCVCLADINGAAQQLILGVANVTKMYLVLKYYLHGFSWKWSLKQAKEDLQDGS